MLDLLDEALRYVASDLGIGVVVWAVALMLPFRELQARKEIGWDCLGYIGSAVFGLMIVVGLEEPAIDQAVLLVPDWRLWFEDMPWWVTLPAYLLASDFGSYWAHRALHSSLLWHSHAWHHSPKYLYFLSGTRAAPLHIIVLVAPTTLAYLFFPDPQASTIALLHVAFQFANQHYLHSNLWFPFAGYLEYAFVTPRVHFVHHSRERVHADSNYGFIFTIWDRLFGTYTDPDMVPRDQPLGLNYEISNVHAFFGLPPARR
jgi:sterol desaturase/sphingolipid hydroxylase (fatty acid hydroxylase superfamily)